MKSNWKIVPEQAKKATGKSYLANENTYLNGSKPVAISCVLTENFSSLPSFCTCYVSGELKKAA